MAAYARALVTGASRGIGEGFARRLAADGCDLVLVARSADDLHALATELEAANAITADVLVADLADPAGLTAVATLLADLDAPIDLLINNAGLGTAGRFVDTDLEHEQALVDVNVTATMRLTHVAARTMDGRGRGAIVNVSSITSFQPGPHAAVYAAGKTLIRHLTEALHEELRRSPVRVQALCPGFTRTAMVAGTGADPTALPDAFWSQVSEVVDASLAALERDRVVCVPGRHNRLVSTLSPLTPGPVRRRAASLLGRRFDGR